MEHLIVDNIFKSVKSTCQVDAFDDAFDNDLYILTQGAISSVAQAIDIRPGFKFTTESTWVDLMGHLADNPEFANVKTYVCMKVKTVFDPGNGPTVQFLERYLSEELTRARLSFAAYRQKMGGNVYRDDEEQLKVAAINKRKIEHLSRLRGGVDLEQRIKGRLNKT